MAQPTQPNSATAPRRPGRPRNPSVAAALDIDETQYEPASGVQNAGPARGAQRPASLRRRRRPIREDKFQVDPSIIPEGMVYQWNTWTVAGKEAEDNLTEMQEYGLWTFVPADREGHQNLGHKAGRETGMILKEGLVLMERPKEIDEEAREEEYEHARGIRATQMQRNGLAPRGNLPREHVKVGRSVEQYVDPDQS